MDRNTRLAYTRFSKVNLDRENILDQYEPRQIRRYIRTAENFLDRYMDFFDSIPRDDLPARRQVLDDINLIESVIEKFQDHLEMRGGGLFKRDKYKFPPKTRKILEKRGNEKLGTIVLYKYLLPDVSKLTKIFSKSGKVPYDDIYHLGMAFNNLRYDKDAVVTLEAIKGLPSGKPKLETLRIPIDLDITINEFIDKHQKKMGQERYWNYKALSWNCQDFTMNALKAIGKWNEGEIKDFVLQDPKLIKSDLPDFASSAANFLNELKLIINRQIEGEGHGEYKGDGDIYDFLFLDKDKIRKAREKQGFTQIKGKGREVKILF